jgi:hypothetical protein
MITRAIPRISVVIPTREHCETLGATLQTCVGQAYEKLEILVCDNASLDRTQDVVRSIVDPRIRYVRTDRRLSMSHNWEYAISQATGDYITVLGDDDGLIPGAIEDLSRIVGETGTEAISWRWASYFWPSSANPVSRNFLFIPQGRKLLERRSSETLASVLRFERGYEELPLIYKGLASAAAVQRAKAISGGQFIHSLTPDVYAAIALALTLDRYLYSERPYSINGTSAKSQGASQFNPQLDSSERDRFLSESNIAFHPDLVYAPSHPIIVAEAYLQAKLQLPSAATANLDIQRLLVAALREVRRSPPVRYEEVVSAVRIVGERHGMSPIAHDAIAAAPRLPEENPISFVPGYNLATKALVLDANAFGIKDVFHASELARSNLDVGLAGAGLSKLSIVRTNFRIAAGLFQRYMSRALSLLGSSFHSS